MRLLKKYGQYAAGFLIALGCASLLAGIAGLSGGRTALVWMENEDRFLNVRLNHSLAANVLLEIDVLLYPRDDLYFNGLEIPFDFRLPNDDPVVLTYKSAQPISVVSADGDMRFYSSAPTLGQALWEQGIILSGGDLLSMPLETPLTEELQVHLERGREVTIRIGEQSIQLITAAKTVEGVLLEAGISLQNLDYSRPQDDQPVPENREIEVVRVREETRQEDEEIPFTVERVMDWGMNIGEQQVLQTGQNGILTTAVRVRYENNEEVARTIEFEWVSQQPISQRTAVGTKAVVQTLPEGLDYYLAREVRVVSYHDTGQPTATGVWPYYGVIAVSPEWFSILRGSRIFVPGYGVGTVLDVCPGCSGRNMIDVFYPIAEYIPWSRTLTVYFLTPMPSGFSGALP